MTFKDWELEHLSIMDRNNEGNTFETFITDPNRMAQTGHIMSQVKKFNRTVCALCIDYEHEGLQKQVYHWYKVIKDRTPFGPRPKLIPRSLYNAQAKVHQYRLEHPELWMTAFIESSVHKQSDCPKCLETGIQNPFE